MCLGRLNSLYDISFFSSHWSLFSSAKSPRRNPCFCQSEKALCEPLKFQNYLRKIIDLKFSVLYTKLRKLQCYQISFLGSSYGKKSLIEEICSHVIQWGWLWWAVWRILQKIWRTKNPLYWCRHTKTWICEDYWTSNGEEIRSDSPIVKKNLANIIEACENMPHCYEDYLSLARNICANLSFGDYIYFKYGF